jgi:general secretion pathway protein G
VSQGRNGKSCCTLVPWASSAARCRQPQPCARPSRAEAGFSLIELLVVLALLGLLIGLVAPKAISYFSRAKTNVARI